MKQLEKKKKMLLFRVLKAWRGANCRQTGFVKLGASMHTLGFGLVLNILSPSKLYRILE
jgi:hypothetical protein